MNVKVLLHTLRGGTYLDGYGYAQLAKLASSARGDDANGYRAGFVQRVKLADGLSTHGHDGTGDTAAR